MSDSIAIPKRNGKQRAGSDTDGNGNSSSSINTASSSASSSGSEGSSPGTREKGKNNARANVGWESPWGNGRRASLLSESLPALLEIVVGFLQ